MAKKLKAELRKDDHGQPGELVTPQPVEVVPQILPDVTIYDIEKTEQILEEINQNIPQTVFEDEHEAVLETEVFDVSPSTEKVIVSVEVTEPKKEPLLTVRVTEDFKDGALASRFAALGYPLLWKSGETREIPMTLFIRCKRSGAKFEL